MTFAPLIRQKERPDEEYQETSDHHRYFRYFRSLRSRAEQVNVKVITDLGIPHQRIVEQAEKLGANRIVISTHGRSGARRLLLGSVAEQVVRHAACPVLTVRNPAAKTD